MKGMIVRGAAIALFAALMTVGGTAAAYAPTIPCTAANQGQQTTTPIWSGYFLWECHNGEWMFLLQYHCDDFGNCIPY